MGICSEGYKEATEGRKWKTDGDDVQYDIEVSETKELTWIHVFYQCSMSKRDWQNNFDFIPIKVKLDDGKSLWVFRGLWKAFISAWSTVYQGILNCIKKDKPYYVTFSGHSFGGAMSVFSALMWSRLQKKSANYAKSFLMTWGAPKVLLGKSAAYDLQSCTRGGVNFACHNDLVARMPPFYPRYKGIKFVGEKFNLFKMLFKAEHYHTCYGEIED